MRVRGACTFPMCARDLTNYIVRIVEFCFYCISFSLFFFAFSVRFDDYTAHITTIAH